MERDRDLPPLGARHRQPAARASRDGRTAGHRARRSGGPSEKRGSVMVDAKAVKDALRRHRDRAAVLGLRQQRDPVQGVRAARRAQESLREGRRRRPGAQVHRGRARSWPSTSRGTRPTTTRCCRATPRTTGSASARSTPTPSRTTTTGSAACAAPTRGRGPRPPRTCSSASTSWTPPAAGTSSCGSPTAPTTRARTTSPPARTGWPRPWPRSTRGSGRTSGCCWSTSCSSRRSTPPTCPTGARPCCTARRSATRPRSWWTPATTRPG